MAHKLSCVKIGGPRKGGARPFVLPGQMPGIAIVSLSFTHPL